MIKSVVVTGANGFIGRNLSLYLRANKLLNVHEITRSTSYDEITRMISDAEIVVHLAGANRPDNVEDLQRDNVDFTETLLSLLASVNPIPVIYVSSSQAELNNPYGLAKRAAEGLIESYGANTGSRVSILRLPNVFGKWCRPNYNSVVATFIHNITRGITLRVDDPDRVINLAYIDEVVEIIALAADDKLIDHGLRLENVYRVTLGELAKIVTTIHESRSKGEVLELGGGFMRALYSTYVSALEPSDFSYELVSHVDERGSFTEVLRSPSSGQISFLTVSSGATRGSHYHHSKIEKFVVVAGSARFRFRSLLNGQAHEIFATAGAAQVIESAPGWVHDITNIETEELVVLVWANEVFEASKPDTYSEKI